MGLPTIRQRFQSDLQYRLGLVAYVPILCLGVLAVGGLVFLPGSTGVRIYGIFALLGVGLSALVAHRTIKSVLDSLDRVAGSARDLVSAQEALLDDDRDLIAAWRELDESSQDELGFLASAVNAMYRNTLEIDRNQNESIKKGISNIVINLARRSQALLDRQVEYIDQLENTEEDPDRLEQMFKVDHLATRMRRNAESLLVLAEADPGRRRGGPVDVADVLRVAMGEIENYLHIELSTVEPGQVTSAAAVDLAHMAAELMENATQFSPPDTPVEVSGHLVDGQYVVSIVDHGMGMPDEQLAKANATLTSPPELGLAMGRSLGFVVIGRLAQRVGAHVDLSRTTSSGITARIAVPTSVFTEVGDNTGIRRSVLAPEPTEAPEPEAGQDQAPSNSPALSKLLGLDPTALTGSGAPDDQPVETGADSPEPESIEAKETWTPPPVTPDAPISLPPEVAGLAEVISEEGGWNPPDVSRDADAPPLTDRSMADTPLAVRSEGEPQADQQAELTADGDPFDALFDDQEFTVAEAREDSNTGEVEAEAAAPVEDEAETPNEDEAETPNELTEAPWPVEDVAETPDEVETSNELTEAPWPVEDVAETPDEVETPNELTEAPWPVEDVAETPDEVETPEATEAPWLVEGEVETPDEAREAAAPVEDVAETPDEATEPPWPVDDQVETPNELTEAPAAEMVPTGEPPTNLEDALPTGRAFETGMASLLEQQPETAAVADSAAEPDSPAASEATTSGLTRRKRGQSRVPIGEGRPVAATTRDPDEIRSMLSRYRDGIKGNKSPAEPGEEA